MSVIQIIDGPSLEMSSFECIEIFNFARFYLRCLMVDFKFKVCTSKLKIDQSSFALDALSFCSFLQSKGILFEMQDISENPRLLSI